MNKVSQKMEDIFSLLSDSRVGVVDTESSYCESSPYHPEIAYPEYPFVSEYICKKANPAYAGLRELLIILEFDRENYGTSQWNPFGHFIKPGDNVVINPNFVLSEHKDGGNLYSIITHPSLIIAIMDYCVIALQGEGIITIADAPQMDCNFQELIQKSKLDDVLNFYRENSSVEVNLLDLRDFWLDTTKEGYISNRNQLPGDPKGGLLINLGKESYFYDVKGNENFYGADYNRNEVIKHHSGETQEYLVSKTILDADVVISVPKLKVHKKVGVTLNMKGLVGINTNKNYLVHYRLGSPKEGGDQYPNDSLGHKDKFVVKLKRWMFDQFLSRKDKKGERQYNFVSDILYRKTLKKLGIQVSSSSHIDCGNWYGNDSAWRMVCDLTKIFFFIDTEGKLQKTPQRKIFSVIDGIIGGEGDGPLRPSAKKCGILVGGHNLVTVDIVGSRLMGFDFKKIKQFKICKDKMFEFFPFLLDKSIKVVSKNERYSDCLTNSDSYFNFVPSDGWIGNIEI